MCGLLLSSHIEDHLLASLRLHGPLPVFASDAHKLAGYPDRTCELCAVWHDCAEFAYIVSPFPLVPSSQTLCSLYLLPPLCIT